MQDKENKTAHIISIIGSTAANFIIWVISIFLNAVPLYLKYSTDASTNLAWYRYILADKECTFIFIAVEFILFLEGGYFFHKGKKWENVVSWIIRILTGILCILLFVTYFPNATNEVALAKNQNNLEMRNTIFLITTVLLGLFGHVFIIVRKIVSDS